MEAVGWNLEIFFLTKTLVDGTKAHGVLARRRVNGEWQYRLPTADEEEEYATLMW